MIKFYQNYQHFYRSVLKSLIVILVIMQCNLKAAAQCPPNIDFELGDFTGWNCWIGTHYILPSGKDTIDVGAVPVAPDPLRHVMLSTVPGNGTDPFGLFPMNCPNGSGHSIQLGNTTTTTGQSRAQGVSYTFTIPPGQNKFTLVYNYAIVLLNSAGSAHTGPQEAAFEIEVKNITDNTLLSCSSYPFHATSSIPGFFPSPNNFDVKCKDWAANSINLDNNDGKTIQIFFKSATCTPSGHWGYAYVDVNTECGSAFTGATFCPDDTAVTVTAPFGYQSYQWYSLTNPNLGNQQSVVLDPPPLSGDSIFVDLTPFNGYGCPNTLKAYLFDTLTVKANAGPDRAICDNNPVQLGYPPEPGRSYSWSPVTGLSDPTISNPIATPSVSTTYTLTVRNNGGGCATPDIVNVDVDILSDSLELVGPSSHCTNTGQTVVLKVLPHDSIQWYRNGLPIPAALGGVDQLQYTVTQSGDYHAMVFSDAGCDKTTRVEKIDIWESPVIGFTTNKKVQCNDGNEFIFTNTSTLNTGVLLYDWDMGDGNKFTSRDITHSYLKEGKYTVKLIITAPGGCQDSIFTDVVVNPTPVSAFSVDVDEQCFKNNWFVFNTQSTVSSGILTYTWDFGDGNFDNSNDIAHRYAQPGTYMVKLTAMETNGGCTDDSTFPVIVHQSPVPAFAINNDVQCFPGHQFIYTDGTSILSDALLYTWSMGDGVTKDTKDVTYNYLKAGSYSVKMVVNTPYGCKDSAVQKVIVHPVPSADFTITPVCENLLVPVINRTFNNTTSTVNYLWDFGNGHLDNVKSPVYAYPAAGTYTVKLSVSTAQCPVSFDTKSVDISIEDQLPGVVYPDKDAAFNFNEQLQARPIGSSVIWTPATNLSNRFSFSPVFRGITPQLYTVQITTAKGCITVDTQLVKTHKKIEIYVPTGFTPNGNGINERLRPVLIGFAKVNYFRIYDRWGKMLFSMNSDQPGWDGRVNGKTVDVQTVVWMIEAVDVDGKVHHKQGTTVVIK
jgi:gliding motility-associated-like protein